MNVFRKQAGRFRRLTATQILTLLRNQQPRQAALLRLLPCLSMLAVCAVLLDSLLPIPLWAIASLTVVPHIEPGSAEAMAVAEHFWQLYAQDPAAWTAEATYAG